MEKLLLAFGKLLLADDLALAANELRIGLITSGAGLSFRAAWSDLAFAHCAAGFVRLLFGARLPKQQ